ncbi:MAG: class I tRNA ligase family protein [Candidatus Bathyarchaeota archaeon]|nr:class I tRNA ligase family protein [Candidatus Bathyarchaeota archaeon]
MLNLYNTLTRKIEAFHPIAARNVKMYSCGPSTYQPPHIGNYRTFLFEDILQRYLEYLGYPVTRLMCLTDIEDKAIIQAKKENLTVEALTQRNEAVLFSDFEFLRIKKPAFPIRASSAVDQAAMLTEKLVDLGYAYWHRYRGVENAYFDPQKFVGFGKLAHLDMSKWPRKHRRFHKDTYPGTPWNRGDFILWHGCGLHDVCYDTAVGEGRPAWNIQDPAIATKHLGFEVDVACGGIDALVRHHDYNLAVAEAVSGKPFSRYWLHGGHLFVDGKKMSKSLGNVYYPQDVHAEGYSGGELRFFLVYGAYREKLNFTFELLGQSKRRLDALRGMVADLQGIAHGSAVAALDVEAAGIFECHMNNDLDVKGAFDGLYRYVEEIHSKRAGLNAEKVKKVLNSLSRADTVLHCLL